MYKLFFTKIYQVFQLPTPATGIGLFRLLYGLITLQEIFFLIYFNHLIFDPIPYMDVEFPMITPFLWLWAITAFSLMIGYRCQTASIANYLFWLVFVNFTPMQRDFDGGFDLFMIGANFFLIFMPLDKAFSVDALRKKLATPFVHYPNPQPEQVSRLAYYVPVVICLGFLYLDSAIHKMFAEHWRNGLGAWLPSSMPYYVSALDMSWLLNAESLQRLIGYTIIVFQFTFLPFFHFRLLRPFYLLVGMALHLGITLSFNIYPFGLGMLIFYTLMMPFSWYRSIGNWLKKPHAILTVFYDEQCPLCNRTALILKHFDILNAVDFKSAQTYAGDFPALKSIDKQTLLTDLYALDNQNQLYAGVATYAQIFIAMGYCAPLGWFMKLPLINPIANATYRRIADNRTRVNCDISCVTSSPASFAPTFYDQIFQKEDRKQEKRNAQKISKLLLVIFVLQLNCTLHYGLLYRLKVDTRQSPISSMLADMSNALLMFSHTFLGITPHALYLHDHFEGYEHILAITYLDTDGKEHWLPFVNQEGRLLSPNWGRVHSMWANIAVTPNIDEVRLKKFIMKVTAFWGRQIGLDLDNVRFIIKMKKIASPSKWEKDLRSHNLSGDWLAIGSAQWEKTEIKINLPKDIDNL